MSRIGKLPVELPSGVKANVADNVINIEGKRGKMQYTFLPGVKAIVEGNKILVSIQGTDAQSKTNYGTLRAQLKNIVLGVSTGWTRTLELSGVGFTAVVQGSTLVLNVGFSHQVNVELPKEIKCQVTKNEIALDSNDRELLGTIASKIRKICPPEPYLGKGIKYAEEKVRRKAGKTGKAAK